MGYNVSRSFRHKPITGLSGSKSEKRDKQLYNRKYRRKVKQFIHCGRYDLPQLREVSELYNMVKDGKRYHNVYSCLEHWKWYYNFRMAYNYNGKYCYEENGYLKLWYKLLAK